MCKPSAPFSQSVLSNTFPNFSKPFQSLVFVSYCFHLSVLMVSFELQFTPHCKKQGQSIIGLLVASVRKIKNTKFCNPFCQIQNGFEGKILAFFNSSYQNYGGQTSHCLSDDKEFNHKLHLKGQLLVPNISFSAIFIFCVVCLRFHN